MRRAFLLFVLLFGCSKNSHVLIIQNKGSDTLVNLAQAWAEVYKSVNPDVAIAVSGGGSGTGIAALINGTVDIANSSRAMKQEERDEAKKIMVRQLMNLLQAWTLLQCLFIQKIL